MRRAKMGEREYEQAKAFLAATWRVAFAGAHAPPPGLDPVSAKLLDDLISELRDALGTTFVIVSHELASIFAIASNGIYLDVRTRRVTARGNPSELVRDPHTELQALRFLTRGEAGGPQQQD